MDITKDKPKNIKDKKKKKAQPQTFSQIIWSWTKTIVGAIIVVTILNGLAIASFVVPTGSMEKTVMTGDFLFVNKFQPRLFHFVWYRAALPESPSRLGYFSYS